MSIFILTLLILRIRWPNKVLYLLIDLNTFTYGFKKQVPKSLMIDRGSEKKNAQVVAREGQWSLSITLGHRGAKDRDRLTYVTTDFWHFIEYK